jgi:hypothetical protein
MTDSIDLYKEGMEAWGEAGKIEHILNAKRDIRSRNKAKAISAIKTRGLEYLNAKRVVDSSFSAEEIPYENIERALEEARGEQYDRVDDFAEGIERIVKRKDIGPSLENLAVSDFVRERTEGEDREHLELYREVEKAKAVVTKFVSSERKGYAGLSEDEMKVITNYAIIGIMNNAGEGKEKRAAEREARLTASAVRTGYYPREKLIEYAVEGVKVSSDKIEERYSGRTVRDIAGEVVVNIVENGSADEFNTLMANLHRLYEAGNKSEDSN